MTFQEAISAGFAGYVDFNTRSSRSAYWFWTLFVLLVSIATAVIDSLVFGAGTISPLNTLASLALLLPGLAVSVRRLHDIDRSGWWILIIFIPLIGLLVLIYWAVQPGTPGTNEYGDDPLGDAAAT